MRVGQTRIQIGNYVGAIEHFNIVIKFKPQLPEPYFYRGVAKHHLEDFRGSIRDYDQAISIKPYYPDAFINRGLAYLELKEYDAAIADYNRALDLDPNNAAIYNNRGIAKLSMKNIEGAIEDYNKALEINPNFINAFINRSNANILKGDIPEAIRDLNRAIIIRPHFASAYLLRGLARFELEDYAAALRDFDQTIKLDPKNAYAYNNRGIVKQKLEDYQGAIMDYDLALDIDNTLPNAYFNRGIAKEILKQPGFEHDYEVAAKLDPKLNIRQRMMEEEALAQQQRYGQRTQQQQNTSTQQQQQQQQQAQNTRNKRPAQTPKRPDTQTEQKEEQKEPTEEELQEQRDRRRFRLSLADTRNLPTDEEQEVDDGRIQNRNIIIELQDIFVISSYSKNAVDYERLQYYNLALEELNSFNNYTPMMSISNIKTTKFVDHFRNNILYFNEKVKTNKVAQNYLSRGIFKFLVNEYSEAMADFDQAVKLDEKNTLAHFSRANCRTKMVELLESLPDYSEDLTVPVGGSQAATNQSRQHVSDYEHILEDYQVCESVNPKFPFSYYNKAYILCKLGRYHEAISNLDQAIELQADFAEAYFNRGLTKIYLDDVDGGAEDLSKAGELGIQAAYNVIKRYCN